MSLVLPAKPSPAVSLSDTGLASFVAHLLRRLAQRRSERRAARELSRYPDALLKDMGITRSDIDGAVRYGRSYVDGVDHGNSAR